MEFLYKTACVIIIGCFAAVAVNETAKYFKKEGACRADS